MTEWKPNEEVLEDLIRNLISCPNKDQKLPYAATYPEECSIQEKIDDLNKRTERGRNIYERHLERFYLKGKNIL